MSNKPAKGALTSVFWYRLQYNLTRIIPTFLHRAVVWILFPLIYLAAGRYKRVVARNLEVVLGPCGFWERRRRMWRTCLAYGWLLIERYERMVGKCSFHGHFEHLERWNGMQGGFVMVTAHVGNWEAGSALPSELERREVHVVREAELDPRAQEFFRDKIKAPPGYVTHFASEDPSLGFTLLRALRDGAVVALQGDRPREGGKVETVRLFGRPVSFPAGPAALARAAGVPMLPIFVFRVGRRRYRVVIREPIEPDMQAVAREVEWAIREEPHQWFCWTNVFLAEG